MLPLLIALVSFAPFLLESTEDLTTDIAYVRYDLVEPSQIAEDAVSEPIQQAAVSRGMGNDVEQWTPLVAGQFPPDQVENALCVIRYESGGNPDAKNPRSEARGLFQVMASVWASHYGVSYSDLYSPEINTYVAAQIWGDAGWKPWSSRTRRGCGL